MIGNLLNRDDAPVDAKTWELIDRTVQSVATQTLSARKLLHIEGPYGLGVKFVPGHDSKLAQEGAGELTVSSAQSVPVTFLSNNFTLNSRDLDLYSRSGILFDMKELVASVLAIAEKEDNIIFTGLKSLGVMGLMNSPGVLNSRLKPWTKIGDAAESVIAALDQLDSAGYHGPYSLALAPSLYNSLFRRYPQEEVLEIEHLRALVTEGIIKAPTLKGGGVLVSSGIQFSSIVLGQDLMTGFEGPSGRDYIFVLSVSIALRVNIPHSVCILEPAV